MPIEQNNTTLLNSLNSLRLALRLRKGAAIRKEDGQDGSAQFDRKTIKTEDDPALLHFSFPPVGGCTYLRNDLLRDLREKGKPSPNKLCELYSQTFEPMEERWDLLSDYLRCNYETSFWVQKYKDSEGRFPDSDEITWHELKWSDDRYLDLLYAFLKEEETSAFWKENQIIPSFDDLCAVIDINLSDVLNDNLDDVDVNAQGIKKMGARESDMLAAWVLIWLAGLPCGSDAALTDARNCFVTKLVDEIQKRFHIDEGSEDPGAGDQEPDDPKYVDEMIRKQGSLGVNRIVGYEDLHSLITKMLESVNFAHNYNRQANYNVEQIDEMTNLQTKDNGPLREHGITLSKKRDY